MNSTITDMLDTLFREIDAITAQLKSWPNLDEYGIPIDLENHSGLAWQDLLEQRDKLTRQACQLTVEHTPGQTYRLDAKDNLSTQEL